MKIRMPKSFIALIVAIGVCVCMFVGVHATEGGSLTEFFSSTIENTTETVMYTQENATDSTVYSSSVSEENNHSDYSLSDLIDLLISTLENDGDEKVREAAAIIEERVSDESFDASTLTETLVETISSAFEETGAEIPESATGIIEEIKKKIKGMYAGEVATTANGDSTDTTVQNTTTVSSSSDSGEETTPTDPYVLYESALISIVDYFEFHDTVSSEVETAFSEFYSKYGVPDSSDLTAFGEELQEIKNMDTVTQKLSDLFDDLLAAAIKCNYADEEATTDSGNATTTEPYATTAPSYTTTTTPETTTKYHTTTTCGYTTTTEYNSSTQQTTVFETTTGYYAHSGICGDNLTWSIDLDARELVISGTGAMTNWSPSVIVPWFNYRSGILSVTIGDGVTSIGDFAFYDFSNLINVTIPDSVTSIGEWAFINCNSLSTITIPAGVTIIEDAFPKSFTNITVDSANTAYSSDEYGVLFNKDKTELILYPNQNSRASYKIPDSVTSIGYEAFSLSINLTDVTIPDSVTSIGGRAFASCYSLSSVTIPDSVTSIGTGAFVSCNTLVDITVDSANTTYSSDKHGVLFNKDKTVLILYPASNSRTNYEIPTSVGVIASYAFSDCSSLKSITIPDSVMGIGEGAFSDCSSLESITIPDSVMSLEHGAFAGCSSLSSCTIPDSVTKLGQTIFMNCTSLTNVVIGKGVTSIPALAFNGCTSLTSVTLPDSVTSIEYEAFANCLSLEGLTIPDTVTEIVSAAFSGCSSLTSIEIPDSVTSIMYGAFSYCNNLEYIHIPASVAAIGDNILDSTSAYICSAAEDCYAKKYADENGLNFVLCEGHKSSEGTYENLTYNIVDNEVIIVDCDETATGEIIIPSEIDGYPVTSIGEFAFKNCDSITSVIIGNNVTDIKRQAFQSCDSLKKVTFPESLESIWSEAFNSCRSLTEIQLKNNVKSIGFAAFYNTPLEKVFYRGTYEEWDEINIEDGNTGIDNASLICYTIPPTGGDYEQPVLDSEFEVNTPTTSTVNYGDTLILHALVSEIPEGCSIVWSVEGTGVTLSPSADGITCAVTCTGSGAVRVTATVIDSQGNVVLDSDGNECVSGQTLTAKAGFFQKLISFFKNLFGILRIIPQSFKASF